jgi:hypothetical protein
MKLDENCSIKLFYNLHHCDDGSLHAPTFYTFNHELMYVGLMVERGMMAEQTAFDGVKLTARGLRDWKL